MKMKNLVAFAMLALGAVAAPFAGHAEVSGGDIYSVDLSTKFGGVIPSPGTTLTIGEGVTVRVRLVNKANSEGMPLDWYFFENTTMPSGTDPTTAYFAPQLGLMLGGQQVFADYLGSEQTAVSGKNKFTDLYFHYTVKSGDLALPARFMTIDGKAVGGDDDATDYAIHFCNYLGAYWKLTNSNGDSCVFHFCNDPLVPNPDPTWEAGEPHRWITGTKLGINVKTVDFDTSYYKEPSMPGVDDGIWRQLYVGLSTALPSLPAVKVDGFADVSATMYVWVENEDNDNPVAQVLASDNPEKITDTNPYTGEVTQRWVIKVPIAKSAQSASFKLQGVREGTVKVRMSASRELSYEKSGLVIEDWVERNVSVVPAPNPYVMVETLNMAGDAQTIFTCPTEYRDPVGMFRITFSQPPTDSLTVSLRPDDPTITNEHLIAVSKSGTRDDMPWEDLTLSFDLAAGEMPPPLYVYALGGTSKKFTFTPVLSGPGAAMYTGEAKSSSIYIEGVQPVITSPKEDDVLSAATLGVDYKLNISVSDTYRMLNTNGWTVSLCCSAFGDEDWHDFTDLKVNTKVGNRITVTIPKDGPDSFIHAEEDLPIEIMVANKNEIWSEEVVAYISVREGKVASATVEGGEEEFAEGAGRTAKVFFSLSQSDNKNLYAFIEPINSDASNKVTSAQLAKPGNTGVLISRGKTDSGSNSATVSLQDGDASALFQVVLCSAQTYSESSKVTTYTPGQCTINITNVVPQVTAASMGGQAIKVNGGVTKAVAQNVEKKFTVSVSEPSLYDLDATGDDAFLTQWKFGTSDWEDMKGNPNTTNILHTFHSPGDQEVTVRCQDKDMRKLGQWSEEFTFTVPVLDQPKVIIAPVGERNQYYEDETGANTAFAVSLTAAPDIADSTARLTLKLTVKNNTTGAEEPSTSELIELSRYEVTFSSGVLSGPTFFLTSLDGTAASAAKGYTIKAEVTNAVIDVEGKTWEAGETEVYVINRAPAILNPSEKLDKDGNPIASTTAIGTENTLAWSLRDVDADKTDMSVTWETSEGQRKTYKQGDPGWADVMSGTHTFKFESAGEKSITLTALDKDGESVSRTFYYTISPSKSLKLIPHGPTAGKGTALSKRYRAAAGIGEGRVWAKNASTVEGFEALYNCGLSKSWTIYAYGYKVGETSGAVTKYASRETPLDAGGNANPAGGYAYADSEKDSFLYTWIQLIRGESGGFSDSYLNGATSPEYPEIVDVGAEIALPAEPGQDGNYDDTLLEAVFSKEFLPADNMGDINQDGIPDAYVDKYGLGVVDDSGKIVGNDLDPADDWNDDADYIPAMETSPYGALIPGLKGTWVTLGTPFDAKFEFRGYHEGLNDAAAQIGLVGVKPDRVYAMPDGSYNATTCTISRLEYEAWKDSGLPADKWSPERPTDPTKEDTDKDGMPDGYEYYFWYKAHVGYVDVADGKHKYMTGRRYNPVHPCEPDLITSAEIEKAMDPLDPGDKTTVNTRDTDNDGLSDVLEFEIGTNPFDYDTDGDGLPDGYEMLIGTDPLDANGYADTKGNPDGDAMAYEYLENKYEVYGLLTDSGELVYRAIKKLPFGADFYEPVTASIENGSSVGPGWRLVTAEGGVTNVFYTSVDMEGKWRTEVNGEGEETYVLCADLGKDVTRALRKIGDEYYLGLPTYLPRGTVLAVQPLTVDEVKTQRLAMIRDDGTPVGTGDFTLKDGVPPNRFYAAFRYGMEGLDKGEKPVWGRFAVCGDAEIKCSWPVVYVYGEEVEKSPVYLIHHISYAESGFDPRTAWSASQAKSRAFATYDEFLALAFHWHVNTRGFRDGLLANSIDGIVPSRVRPWTAIWKELCTDPFNADSDLDGMPDGWELYVMAGPRTTLPKPDDKIPVYAAPHPLADYGPLHNYGLVGDKAKPDSDNLDFQQEYCGVESVAAYPDVATIVDVHPEWRNKKWPTDPWNADTDGDGLTDGEEGKAFIYGDPAATGAAGGGLNPLSWDTDGDGLPDPWELEFQGSYTEGASQVEHATTVAADGTTNSTTKVLHAGGSWSGGMDGTVNDANADYDFDGLLNWQEYMVGSMRCWRYDDTFSSWSLQSFDEGEFMALDPFGDPEGYGRYWYERIVCIPARDKLMGPLPCPPAQGVITENPERGSYEYNPRFVNSIFDAGSAYFSLCTNEWDTAHNGWYMFRDGVYHDLKNPGEEWAIGEGNDKMQFNRYSWWVFLRESMPPFPFVYMQSMKQAFIYPTKYICCDPTKADTDNDGMDDYYELFHGLNPLLGKSAGYDTGHKPAVDIVFEAYGGGTTISVEDGQAIGFWSAENNFWLNSVAPQNDSDTGATLVRQPVSKNGAARDFVAYPWLGGLADADPDGDDIRNQEEAIMPNLQANSSWHHTDPTPLWMTDLSYAKSLTYRYYRPISAFGWQIGVPSPYFTFDWNGDGLIDFKTERFDFRSFPGYDWDEKKGLTIIPYALHEAWGPVGTIYSFEENEGFDSDHDYLSDFEESQGKTKPASDPQLSDDPLRRQAMWFDGKTSFLETPLEESEYSPVDWLPIPPELPFLYFTAECWARPDDACDLTKPQTVLERAVWNSPANPGDMNYMRKNFLLGIRNGRWYAKFDSSGTGSAYDSVEITDGPVAEKKWTHLAATYDGTSFKLYMNGVLQVEKLTSITPEHGTWTVTADEAGALRDGKTEHPYVALLVGASAKTRIGIIFDSLYRGESMFGTMRGDYQDFYNGWVDEVRVWDGARTTAQLLADYRKRYTEAECAANRDEVLAAWLEGANFTDNSPAKRPPELRYHYSFDHLPGAVRAADVIPVPAGFNTEPGVVDAKAKHWSRPDDWVSPWWNSVDKSLKSTVYKDFAWTPWIGNTVAHLPRPDGTTVDSMYWSEDYAGSKAAVDLGYKAFGFPRTAEYVSKWTQMSYDRLHQPPITTPTRYELVNALAETDGGAALLLYSFTLRHRTRTGADLLPFGGAFPKRISLNEGGMWDDKGPADAWAETGNDSDNNGLPDWWQAYARANYCKTLKPTDSLDWDTPALYNGILMPAWQAYLRDLARGMLPGGRVEPNSPYADTRDVDGDNMPDWWEDLIGVQTFSKTDATADPDHDGLSNYQEYLVTERDGLYPLNPRLSHSGPGQEVTDYFLRVPEGKPDAGKYLGEVYADHDFMEDDEEDAMGTDRTKYDAYSDFDEDGWSAFSELRYSTFKMGIASRFLSHMFGASEMKDYPIPVVHATLRYNGVKTLAGSNATIVVEAYSGNNLQKAPNAVYTIKPGQTQTRRIFIGPYEDRVVHGTLTPGYVQAGLDQIRLIYAHVQPDDLWSWNVSGKNYKGTYAEMIAAYRLNGTNVTVAAESFGNFDTGIVNTYEGGRQWLQISVDNATQKGHLLLNHERAGDIDLVSGDFSLDLSKIGGYFMGGTGVATEQFFYGIEYSSVLPTLQTKALKVSLAEPDVGSLTEGTTAFVAYMDLNGDGRFTPDDDPLKDEPIGFVKGVEIGWDQVPELSIEMTDSSQAAGKRFAYGEDVDTLRVIRTAINGKEYLDAKGEVPVKRRIVYSREASDMERRTVYEGDLVTAGKFGLDWAALRSDIDAAGLDPKDVTEVSYLVVRDTQSLSHIDESNVIRTITVAYPSQQVKPTPLSPSAKSMPIVEAARPVFKWSGTADNTAFTFQIADAAKNVVFSNDLAVLPPRDASGNYVWTAPVFIGTNVCGDAWALANNSNYAWRVAMFNQKYSRPETDAQWSDWSEFRTALAEGNDFSTQCGTASVTVRYFGPATNDLGDVIVQLFRTADLTGVPAAQTRLFDIDGKVVELTNGTYAVRFAGLESGDYYACAFIDRNGDNVRQRYETWGYVNQVDLGTAALYTPKALSVDVTSADAPSATLFMEDTDVNQNDIPDCLDDEELLKAAVEGGTSGSDTTDTDGDGLTGDAETSDTYTDKQKWDTDGDGMPDGWEAKLADLDPLFNDAAEFMPGDVMAFETEGGVRVRDKSGATYLLLAPSNVTYRVGDLVTNEHLYTCYDYQTVIGEGTNAAAVTYCGFGTNLTGTAATFLIDRIEPVTVAYVHAQVYDRYGYSLKTAIPQDGAIHTKPFTAIDKYMVVRYLAALGLADEETMNRGGTWKNFTLKPMDADNDRDGMLDGWELYVMFGTNGCGYVTNGVGQVVRATTLSQAVISPWKFGDRALDLDGDGLSNVDENCDGNDPSDPWNPYSVYESLVADGVIPPDTEKFDDKVRRFGIGASELDDDWDIDLISNGQEMWSYYIDYANKSTLLADICPTNAWSDGSTPDYFRTFAQKPGVTNYLGAVWNGAEFIEPSARTLLDIADLDRAGTRDLYHSGWDVWSIVRSSLKAQEEQAEAGISEELSVANKYHYIVYNEKYKGSTTEDLIKFHLETLGHKDNHWSCNRGTLDGVILCSSGKSTVEDGLVYMKSVIREHNSDSLEVDGFEIPEPTINFTFKYAGYNAQDVIIDAYQVSSSYPEYGEQLTASWSMNTLFDAGVGYAKCKTTGKGTLKQGPTRFVAYIDVDGNGKLSAGDISGSATAEVGYLGCDLTIALGEANPALPALRLTDGTNTVSTLALVRSAINGKPLYNSAKGVYIVQFPNNAAREALYPDEYDTGSYIGIDSTLSSLENVGEIESVTYEVLRLTADEIAGLSVTNLNNYIIVTTVETDNKVEVRSNVVSRTLNETVTLNYSLDRDVAKSIACAGSTADDFTFTFTVPTDTANTKFWLNVQTNGAEAATLLGGEKGFILKDAREGVVVLDKAWFEANRITIPTGRTKFGVVLGNDKFGRPTPAVCAMAEAVINEGASFDGRLAVTAAHPIAELGAKLTIAVYETADLVNPVFVTNNCAAGGTIELTGLRPDADYYVAAWYVGDANDGRGSKARRMPYDSWGYVTSLGETANGFDAKALKAELVPSVTNTVWLQDTDFNANGRIDREEDFRAINGDYVRSVDPVYGFAIAGVEDAEIFSDAAENDVFAYAEVPFYCVMTEVGGAETWFAVTNLAVETVSDKVTPGIPVGTSLSTLTTLCSTYLYDFGNSNAKRLALGTNVTWTGAEKVMKVGEGKVLVLVHGQVYDFFGFNPNTANGRIDKSAWVNTRAFTSADKAYVTNYVANVLGLADAWTYALPIDYPDADPVANGHGDGVLDGWELYVKHSPWKYDDRTFDADKDGLDQLHEYDGGVEPTDPWNAYSTYENLAKKGLLLPGTVKFTDKTARKFGVTPATLDEDPDLDLISNIQELTAYYRDPTALADLAVTNAWSDGETPDYFRTCGSKYLGEIFNGAEFIETDWRNLLGLGDKSRWGTRTFRVSGWDYWSIVRNSDGGSASAKDDGDLAFVLNYLDAVVPGECTAKTLPELREFVHQKWNGVERDVRQGDYWNDDYSYSYVYDEATGTYHYQTDRGEDDSVTWMTLTGDKLVTLEEMIQFFGGRKMMNQTIAKNLKADSEDDIVIPTPVINLKLKYAGDSKCVVLVEAYQVNPAYPEYGEQRTAFWNVSAEFGAGVASPTLESPNAGSLKQGPARFVAYIDVDGDGKLSPADTFGETSVNVGYLGADVTIRLGDANPALPVLRTGDGSNTTWSTIAIVRSAINGKPLYNRSQGVNFCTFENNVSRRAIFPSEYISDSFVGIDTTLAVHYSGEELENIESVTYEVLRIPRGDLETISVTNLNHYIVITNGVDEVLVTNVYDSAVNEEFTVRYSNKRDKADKFTWAGSTEEDCSFSFSVPDDGFANTRFWLKVNGTEFGGTVGFPLTGLAGGRMVLDSKWLAKNGVAAELKAGEENSFTVMLGNDKFGYDKAGWPDPVKFFVGVKPVFDGKLLVEVRHPANAALNATLTVAAYEKPDLAEPVVTVTGQSLGNVVTLSGLRVGQAYYIAAWYVKDADDGRGSATRRMPYDTWGYLTSLGEAANGFDAKAVAAVDPANRMIEVPMVTNLVFLQDTDWNDNNVIDREEAIVSENSVITGSVSAGGEFKIVDAENPDPQGGSLIDNDVMAYAVVTYPCVSVTVGADEYLFAVTDLANELTTNRLTRGIPVGTPVRELRSLKATYKYDYGKSDPEVIGLGTNVQFAADCDWKVSGFMECGLVLVHAQVYDAFGFCPNTANGSIPSSSWVNTKSFTREDRAFVTNYYANVCGVAEAWKYAIPSGSNDSDADGIINGWELYVMYGPKGAGKNAMAHNPLKPEDRHFDADGDGLDQLHEYDGGYLPTDPWNADTDRDNVTDYYAWLYHLKSPADAAADWDGDGLSNYAEYLIAEVFKLASSVRPDATHSSDGVLDYFRKQGELYLGEIFTDHDHMDDAVEDLFPEMNRYVYDAHEDGDLDGWSNWAEICASVAAGFESVTVAVTNGDRVVTTTSRRPLYAGRPQPELRLKLRYGGVQDIVGASVVIKAYTQPEAFRPDAVFTVSNAIVNVGYNELTVKVPDSGYLREGANTFFVYLAAAGKGGEDSGKGSGDTSSESAAPHDYVAGAPFAVMREVDVGWSTVNLDVQLTDTDPSFARVPFAYAAGNSDREVIWGGSTTTFGTNKLGQTIMHYGTSDVEINPDYTGDISALLDTKLTHIRVIRTRVDGQKATQGSLNHRVIYDKYVPTDLRSFICEYDVIGAGEYDIDWANFDEVLEDDIVFGHGLPVTQVVYRVCIGEGAFNINGTTNVYDEPWIEVSRRFEETRTVPAATADSGVFYSARPTLTWTMGDGGNPRAGDTYSAFRVVITPAKGGSIDSGLMLRPVRDAHGRYSWTGPVLPPGDYTWKVSMYNAKFQTDAFSNIGKFSMATDLQQEMNDHGYGSFGVAVKYAGSTKVLASGKVHVEAYDTPDFSGKPLSETILPANTASLSALASPTANCIVAGLQMGGTYYFRAYIDTNGNGRRDIWESWGYAKADNSDSVAQPFVLTGMTSPVVGLFIEDCDTDKDWLPDAWEMAKNGSLDKQGASVDPAGKIVFRGSTYDDLAGISTGLPGASLTVFNNLAVAKEMLGLPGEIAIDAIRAAVEKKIVESSVKITALTFDQVNGKIVLSVDAQVAETIAGALLSRFYTIEPADTVTVKVKVYKVESLAEAWPKDPEVIKEVTFGAGEQEVLVDLDDDDYTSGFFKIEVEQ